MKRRSRYSIYNQARQSDYQRVRRHSERLAFHRHQPSLTITRRTQHLHYITYKHEKKKSPSGLVFTPIGYSTRTTMINANGMHRTTSDCSNLMQEDQFIQPVMKTNDKRQQLFRT